LKQGAAERGDIFLIDLNPVRGREPHGQRPVLAISPIEFNRLAGVVWVCPIAQSAQAGREHGFAVPLIASGTETQGVVMCHQPCTVDLRARRAFFKEKAPPDIVDEVLARVRAVLE